MRSPALEMLGYRTYGLPQQWDLLYNLDHEQRQQQLGMWTRMFRSNCSADSMATVKEWIIR